MQLLRSESHITAKIVSVHEKMSVMYELFAEGVLCTDYIKRHYW